MAESLACVAPDLKNPLTCKRLYFCQLSFPWLGDPDAPAEGDSTKKDGDAKKKDGDAKKKNPPLPFLRYVDGLQIVPLKQAYVLCVVPLPHPQRGPNDPPTSCLGVTDDDGMLQVITESEIGTAPSKKTPLLLRADALFLYYWTHSATAIRRVLADLKRDPHGLTVLTKHEFFGLRVGAGAMRDGIQPGTPFRKWTPFDFEAAGVSYARAPYLAALVRRLTLSLKRELIYEPAYAPPDFTFATANQTQTLRGGPYHIARCRHMDTIYICELALFQAAAIRQKTAEDFALLSTMLRMCTDWAKKEDVEKYLKNTLSDWRTDQKYYTYAYECAINLRVPRSDFETSIHMAGQVPWRKAANRIADLGVYHPGYNRQLSETVDTLPPKDQERERLIDFFDHHRFALKYKEKLSVVPASDRAIAAALTELRERLRKLVSANSSHPKFLPHLEAHCSDTFDDRKQMNSRYLENALEVGYRYWDDTDERQRENLAELKKSLDWLGTGSDKLGDLMGSHFKSVETLRKYIQIMAKGKKRVDPKELEAFINWMTTLNKVVDGKFSEPKHCRGSMDINYETHELTLKAKLRGTTDEVVGKWVFDLERPWHGEHDWFLGPRQPRAGRAKFVELNAPPLVQGKIPAFLSTVGDTIGLISAVMDLFDEQKRKQGIQVYGKVAMNTFQSVDSWAGLLGMIWKDAGFVSKLERAARVLKGPGLALEVIFNISDGMTILRVEGEDSEAGAAVRRGDIATAVAYEVKGITLTGMSAGGAVACIYGTVSLVEAGMTVAGAFATALTPLGIALAVAGLTCVAIDIGVYIGTEVLHQRNRMSEYEKRVEAALDREYGRGRERTVDTISEFTASLSGMLE